MQVTSLNNEIELLNQTQNISEQQKLISPEILESEDSLTSTSKKLTSSISVNISEDALNLIQDNNSEIASSSSSNSSSQSSSGEQTSSDSSNSKEGGGGGSSQEYESADTNQDGTVSTAEYEAYYGKSETSNNSEKNDTLHLVSTLINSIKEDSNKDINLSDFKEVMKMVNNETQNPKTASLLNEFLSN